MVEEMPSCLSPSTIAHTDEVFVSCVIAAIGHMKSVNG